MVTEQISGWLKRTYPDDTSYQVSRLKTERFPAIGNGDLLFGSSNSQIATLVERQTRYVMLVKVESKNTETVVNAYQECSSPAAGTL